EIRQMGRVLVLPEQVPRVNKEPVVGPISPHNRRQLFLGLPLAALAGEQLDAPARLHVLEEPDAIALGVRKHDIEIAVFVEIDKAEAGAFEPTWSLSIWF